MKKKLIVKSEVEETPVIVERPKLATFDFKFGREDLDKLVDKLNEVIKHING